MKSLLLVALAAMFLASLSSCKHDEAPAPDIAKKKYFVQLLFEYNDGTRESSSIVTAKFLSPSGTREAGGTLVVDGDVVLTSGSYDNIEIKPKSKLRINGPVFTQNVNKSANAEIIVGKGGHFTVGSSFDTNGNMKVTNWGLITSGGGEMQNGNNEFFNYGRHEVTNNLQITSSSSKYWNIGELVVNGTLSIHSGYLDLSNCASVIAGGMDVNGADRITGKGFIQVNGSFNLNHRFTSSPDITLCYNGTLNQPEKIGAAVRSCTPSCVPGPMPVRYDNLEVTSFVDDNGNLLGRVSMDITENTGLRKMYLLISTDAKQWYPVFTEGPDAFTAGKKYHQVFPIQIK
jgi:hypothetical protein